MRNTSVVSYEGFANRREFIRKFSAASAGVAFASNRFSSLAEDVTTGPPELRTTTASILVDPSRKIARIDPKIYGHFIEHFGRCIYGGIYDEGSPLSDADGFRKDVLAAAQKLRIPVLRWPGGNFASSYHWMDAIGPRESRPRRFDPAWFAEESNRFGTDEFIAYCRKLNTEPFICVNMGTGSMDEAAAWVEYCNATTNTHYANLRRKNGHSSPYNVKYWELGNEIYGSWQAGRKGAEQYAKEALEFAKMMKWVDPSIKLIACGSYGSHDPHWDRIVLETLIGVVDYISTHLYVGSSDYYNLLGTAKIVDDRLKLLDGVIEAVEQKANQRTDMYGFPSRRERVEIAFDEWNIWYRVQNGRDRNVSNKQEEPYNLRDALWTATVLNTFQRWGNKVTLANLNQLVNILAPIRTTEKGIYLQPIYFPFELYVAECGNTAIDTRVECQTFSAVDVAYPDLPGPKRKVEIPYLDAQATVGETYIALAVVNRHRDEVIPANIELLSRDSVKADGKIFEINGSSPDVENSWARPTNVVLKESRSSNLGKVFRYPFPAHSITLLKLFTT
jgi:alpha-N-arabinofuranosidase